MSTIKDRNHKDLTEAEDIKKRWQEYTEELYKKALHNPDNHHGALTHLESDILKCEVKWVLGSITTNKTSGGDGIPVELFHFLKDVVKVLHSVCQQIWKTQQWLTSLAAQTVKRLPTVRETRVQSLGREDLLEKEMATHSSILAWEVPWMEEHGRLQSMGSQRVRHNWVTLLTHSHQWPQDWKGKFSFQSQRKAMPKFKLPHSCAHLTCWQSIAENSPSWASTVHEPDVQAGFRKSRGTRDQMANIYWIIEKAREF